MRGRKLQIYNHTRTPSFHRIKNPVPREGTETFLPNLKQKDHRTFQTIKNPVPREGTETTG